MLKAIIHDVASRRTLLPHVHFVYEGENLPFSSPNVLVVDVDLQGEVQQVTPLDSSVEISCFYVQKDDEEKPTLHIQGVFPDILHGEEQSTSQQRELPQSSSDLLEEFLVRNEFIRAQIREARDEGFFSPEGNAFDLDTQKHPPIIPPSIEVDPIGTQSEEWTEEIFHVSPHPESFTSIIHPPFSSSSSPSPTPFSNTPFPTSPRVAMQLPVPPSDPESVGNSPDRRKGAAPTIISPYKGQLPRHPSPTPMVSVKSKFHRPLFLDDPTNDLSRTPSPTIYSINPSMLASPLLSPVSSPPQVELKQQVDRILHSALQLKTSIELMSGGLDMDDLPFETSVVKRTNSSTIRRSDGTMALP